MTDVRLTATNPEDSSVVPVACNEKGELKLEEPQVTSDLYVEKAGDTMSGNLHLADKITLDASSGQIQADGRVQTKQLFGPVSNDTDGNFRVVSVYNTDLSQPAAFKAAIFASGNATFSGDVIIGSRNQQWMIVEQSGLAHLVAQTRSSDIETADLVDPSADSSDYPPLRDIPGELTMVEEQLQKVLEKLRMVPEAGWEVWDGSD